MAIAHDLAPVPRRSIVLEGPALAVQQLRQGTHDGGPALARHPAQSPATLRRRPASRTSPAAAPSDWGHLPDRMNFILNLFRSRQKSLELFDQPFLNEQRLEMAADRIPVGRL